MKILRVNMSKLETVFEDLPDDLKIVGGRCLSSKILEKEISPSIDPLGPDAKLVVAAGPLAGTLAPSCGRISVGGKSPLTLGIKEANAGGPSAQKMDKLGIRAIVVEGQAAEGDMHLLTVNKDGASMSPADRYKGLKNYDFADAIHKEVDENATIISCGIAGERKWKSAAVSLTDKDGHFSRHAARGGLGAVMGSRGLKGIVLDDRDTARVDIADKEAFQSTLKEWAAYMKADASVQNMSQNGTPGLIVMFRNMGTMPALNYSADPVEGFEALATSGFGPTNEERGGRLDPCMPGCLVGCSVVYHDADGNYVTSSFEYETIALMGTNLGIVDPDVVAQFDRIGDDMGIDTIEVGSAMGVAASAGKMTMGDADSAFKLLEEMEQGTEFGNILGNGVVATCKALGIDRIPAVGGQAIPAHDPRVTKPTGVTYQTGPMGADHTAGITYDDPMAKEGQVEKSLKIQIVTAMQDSIGYCTLANPSDKVKMVTFLKDLINARYGMNITNQDLMDIGKDTLKTELRFNDGTDFATAHPKPDFIRTEAAASGTVFDIDPDEMAGIWDKLDGIDPLS